MDDEPNPPSPTPPVVLDWVEAAADQPETPIAEQVADLKVLLEAADPVSVQPAQP